MSDKPVIFALQIIIPAAAIVGAGILIDLWLF